jgi:hypothetical protein
MSIHWAGLADVLLVGLIAGVGLVALFGVGVRLLAQAATVARPGAGSPAGRTVALFRALAYACFALCTAIAIYGLTLLLGK